MKSRILLAVSLVMVLVGTGSGQMHGGSGGGMGGTGAGNSSMGGMRGASSTSMGSAAQSGPMMTPMQRRQLLHITAMQDKKYQTCTQAINRVQGDLSHMQSHAGDSSSSGSPSSSASSDTQQQGDDPTSDLSNDLQDMAQSDDDLGTTLNSDQQAVVASKMKDLDKKTKEMQSLAEQLKSDSGNSASDPRVVQQRIKKLNKLSREIAKEQHDIAAALGISS